MFAIWRLMKQKFSKVVTVAVALAVALALALAVAVGIVGKIKKLVGWI